MKRLVRFALGNAAVVKAALVAGGLLLAALAPRAASALPAYAVTYDVSGTVYAASHTIASGENPCWTRVRFGSLWSIGRLSACQLR
jgi:type 1 fimbria pilin